MVIPKVYSASSNGEAAKRGSQEFARATHKCCRWPTVNSQSPPCVLRCNSGTDGGTGEHPNTPLRESLLLCMVNRLALLISALGASRQLAPNAASVLATVKCA